MPNTPILTQTQERELNRITSEPETNKVDVTVSITMSKSFTINADEMDANDDRKLMTAFDTQHYSIEQIQSILEEYNKKKSIDNVQMKIKDLSGWNVDEKCIVLE